mmetsp:Transcript_11564/g.38027  ORF Transcript_11564/g.38027 Transcript_11564/m.38027 type:complete len:214 (-) Transcript_11564:1131-1772(-)
MTSRIEAESVRSMTRRSTPSPMPAVGGIPYSSARTKSSSTPMAYVSSSAAALAAAESPAAASAAACAFWCPSTCLTKRSCWSTGSVSSEKALASSRPAMKSSKRSATPGSERCGLASGLISSGWLRTKVGSRSDDSTSASNISLRTFPTEGLESMALKARPGAPAASSAVRACAFASATSFPNARKSTPVASSTSSFMVARRHGRLSESGAPW